MSPPSSPPADELAATTAALTESDGGDSTPLNVVAVAAGGGGAAALVLVLLLAIAVRRKRRQARRKAAREEDRAAEGIEAGACDRMAHSQVPSTHAPEALPGAMPAPALRGADDSEARWEWPAATVTWGKRLGNGSFGSVYLVRAAGLQLAAKRVDVPAGNGGGSSGDGSSAQRSDADPTAKMVRREALAMRSLSHPNVIEIVGVVLDHPSYVREASTGFSHLLSTLFQQPSHNVLPPSPMPFSGGHPDGARRLGLLP